MKVCARIARIETVSALQRDQRLKELRDAARDCAELRAQLLGLAGDAGGSDEAPITLCSALVIARHEQWRAARRRELNTRLAAAMARWMACHSGATRALGRHEALRRLKRREDARIASRGHGTDR